MTLHTKIIHAVFGNRYRGLPALLRRKSFRASLLLILITCCFSVQSQNSPLPVLERVLQQGFPSQPDALLQTTNALFSEYENQQNITSLIFYSYGMLRLASHFNAVNDYVNALEFAKLGFFYLDEAVDSHEDDRRIRYLRARVDAYLPANLGRCVVTLADTEQLLENSAHFDRAILAQIDYMRYRALHSCGKYQQAETLLATMQRGNPSQTALLAHGLDGTPEWDMSEVVQIIIPLAKGE